MTSTPVPPTGARWSPPWLGARSSARQRDRNVDADPIRGKWQTGGDRGRASAHACRLPAPSLALNRDACGMRTWRVWRLYGPGRWRRRPCLPDARGAGGRRPGRDYRGAVARWPPHAAAGRVPQASRPAMWLLYSWHDHHGACVVEPRAILRCGACARGAVGQSVPLHRICGHCRSSASRARRLPEERRVRLMKPNNALIGSPIERLEDLRFVRGRGEYVDDLTRAGLLHAAILRSSVAHGRLRSIDAEAARALPHVHSVFTAADIANPVPIIPMRLHPLPELRPFEQPVMAYDRVRYVGEPIAIVLADSAALAEDALAAITVDIETLPAVTR